MATTMEKNTTLRTKPCLALIGDMVGSRELPRSRRPKIQERFKEFIQYLNKRFAKDILSRFVITLGDEFQGLLSSAAPIPDLMWDIEHRFSDRDLRVGVGFGVLYTPIPKEAINVDGPALFAELMRKGLTHMEAANQLKISRQAITKQVRSMGWGAYTEAELAWRAFIEKWVTPTIEKKRAKNHN